MAANSAYVPTLRFVTDETGSESDLADGSQGPTLAQKYAIVGGTLTTTPFLAVGGGTVNLVSGATGNYITNLNASGYTLQNVTMVANGEPAVFPLYVSTANVPPYIGTQLAIQWYDAGAGVVRDGWGVRL